MILSSLYLDTRVIQSIQFKEIISHIIIPLLKQLSHSFRTAMLKAGFCFLIFYVQSSSSEPDTHIHVYVPPEKEGGKDYWIKNCVTQLKLYTLCKLSSPIFCCLCVSEASVSPDQISTFSNIYRHTSPLLTQYNLILSSTELYWPSTTMYQPVPPHTDPALPNISQHSLLLTQYHQVPTSTAPYWPSTTKY